MASKGTAQRATISGGRFSRSTEDRHGRGRRRVKSVDTHRCSSPRRCGLEDDCKPSLAVAVMVERGFVRIATGPRGVVPEFEGVVDHVVLAGLSIAGH